MNLHLAAQCEIQGIHHKKGFWLRSVDENIGMGPLGDLMVYCALPSVMELHQESDMHPNLYYIEPLDICTMKFSHHHLSIPGPTSILLSLKTGTAAMSPHVIDLLRKVHELY